MEIQNISPCFASRHLDECREFYCSHFNASIVFDCGWYVTFVFGKISSQISFIDSDRAGQGVFSTEGLTYCFLVEDVDKEYEEIIGKGLIPVHEIEDHPWGDRSFSLKDPNGITICIYSERPPSAEYREAVKPWTE